MMRRPAHPASVSQLPQIGEAATSLDDLRREWRRLFQRNVPKISRDLLALGIAYRKQELDHGGLGKSTLRALRTFARTLRETGRVRPASSISLKPGARLVREWRGRVHTVTVMDDGFEYGGRHFPSLSPIARTITGAHWSGPRFFGLEPKASRRGTSRGEN